MELEHERWLPQAPDRVWQELNEPEVLRVCMPGCESVERVTPQRFTAVVVARVGPVRARVHGEVIIVDPLPPQRYTLAFNGSGRAFGGVQGRAYVRIAPEQDGARLHYRTEVAMSGRLARLGQRFVNAAALRVMDRFFDAFSRWLAPEQR